MRREPFFKLCASSFQNFSFVIGITSPIFDESAIRQTKEGFFSKSMGGGKLGSKEVRVGIIR